MDTITDGKCNEIMVDILEKLSQSNSQFYTQINVYLSDLWSYSPETYRHSINVANLCVDFAAFLEFDDEETKILGIGGLLHDAGKLDIPLDILHKEGKLTDNEFDCIKQHPDLGINRVRQMTLSISPKEQEEIFDLVRHHHEKLDGSGYPERLNSDNLSRRCRILTIIDIYEAMRSKRSYKDPCSEEEIIDVLLQGKGQKYDSDILEHFLKFISARVR